MSAWQKALGSWSEAKQAQPKPVQKIGHTGKQWKEFFDSWSETKKALHYGDIISLYIETGSNETGFFNVNGIVDERCGLQKSKIGEFPPNFRECLFRVQTANLYQERKTYRKELDHYELLEFDPSDEAANKDLTDSAKVVLTELREKMLTEERNNQKEFQRTNGTPVKYGDSIQLYHLVSKKFLQVSKESGEVQKDSFKLFLDPNGSTSSYFSITPVVKFRIDGEEINLDDSVHFYTKKFGMYLNCANGTYEDQRNEINISLQKDTKWTIRQYSIGTKDDEEQLKSGDVIRLYHKEYDSYLFINHGMNGNLVQLCPAEDLSNNTIYTMWEVELEDVTRGGTIFFNSSYRLRNLATQHLLSVEMNQEDDDEEYLDDIDIAVSSSEFSSPRDSDTKSNQSSSQSLKKLPSLSSFNPVSTNNTNNIEKKIPSLSIKMDNNPFFKNLQNLQTPPDSLNSPSVDSPIDHDRSLYKSRSSEKVILSAGDDDEFDKVGSVKAVESGSELGTLWSFISPSGTSTLPILYDSFTRFVHVDTETWLHAISEKVNFKKSFIDHQRAHIGLETRSTTQQEDVFKITKVNERDVNNFITFNSLMVPLEDYKNRLLDDKKIESLQTSDIVVVSQILSKLIIFITKSSEMNTLERDGVPYPDRQQAVRQTKILETVIEILTQLIKRGVIKTEWFVREKYSDYWRAYRLAYRLIYLSVKNNPEIGDYMYGKIDIMQNHIESIPIINSGTKGIDIGASTALMNVLKNNFKLLSQLTPSQIDFFIKMMIKSDKNDETNVTFLSTICTVHGDAVTKNQDYIISKLLDSKNIQKLLIIPYISNDKEVFIWLNKKKMTIDDFGSRTEHSRHRKYFKESIELLSKLSMGRNENSIAIVNELIRYDIILECIKNKEEGKNLSYDLRTSFVNLLLYSHIDTSQFERKPLCNLTRIWAKIEDRQKKTIFEQRRHQKFDSLKQILLEYFREFSKDPIDVYETDKNIFIGSLIRLCKNMFQFGIYCEEEEVISLVSPLQTLLDGRQYTKKGVKLNQNVHEDIDTNHITADFQVDICDIFQLINDLRMNYLITKFLKFFKYLCDSMSVDDPEIEREKETLEELFKTGYKYTNLETNDSISFENILMDLIKYENMKISTNALNLLFRNHYEREEFITKLEGVELLSTNIMIAIYQKLFTLVTKLQTLATSSLNPIELNNTLMAIQEIVKNSKEQGNLNRSQRILRNLNFDSLIIDILEKKIPIKGYKNQILKFAFSLIKDFVLGNPTNQKVMAKYLDKLVSKIGQGLNVSPTLVEICRNNIAIVSSVDEKIIQRYIQLIAEKQLLSRYLDFLKILLVADGTPIKRNQNLILKELSEKQKDILLLFNDDEGMEQRNELIKKKEHLKNPDGKLNYHIKLLELLRDICKGKVHSTEVKIQYLFSIEEIIQQIQDPYTYLELKNALMEFMDEVYLLTEKKNPIVSSNAAIWNIISDLEIDLNNYLKQVVPNVTETRFIFNTCVQFLSNFFSIHYDKQFPTNIETVIKLVKKWVQISKSTANPKYRSHIRDLIKILQEKIPTDVGANFLKTNVANIELSDRDVIKFTTDPQDDEIKINILSNFIKKVKPIILSDVDMSKFYKETQTITKHDSSNPDFFSKITGSNKTKKTTIQKIVFTDFIPNLIQLLQNILLLENRLEYTDILVKSIKSVQSIVLNEQKISEKKFVKIQNKMSQAGCGKLVVDLLQSDDDEIFSEALILGVYLLDDGNPLVQKEMNESFQSNKGALFQKIKERIRESMSSMKERKSYMSRKQARMEGFLESQIVKGRHQMNQLKFIDTEEFRGVDYIQTLLRFLQLLCEGHNLENQKYLNIQPEAQKSVNLIDETLAFTLRLKKYIDHTNVDVAVQAFDTLTEYVQGPCVENQILLNQSSLYEMANDILENDYTTFDEDDSNKKRDKNYIRLDPLLNQKEKQYIFNIIEKLEEENGGTKILRHLDMIKLKSTLLTTLISVASEGKITEILDSMKTYLHIETISENIKELLSHTHNSDKLLKKIKYELKDHQLYDFEGFSETNPNEMLKEILDEERELCFQYYILLNILADSDSPDGSTRKILNKLEDETEGIQQIVSGTGRIEVVRNDKLERVYFRIPEITKHLSQKEKNEFVENCPRDRPQDKVSALLNETPIFRRKMEHFENLEKSFVYRNIIKRIYEPIRYFMLFLGFIMNAMVFFTVARVFDCRFSNTIPIPGVTDPTGLALAGDFTDPISPALFLFIGLVQLVLSIIKILIYLVFYAPTYVKGKIPVGKGERKMKWEEIPRTNWFYVQYGFYVLTDPHLWDMILIFVLTTLTIIVYPAFISFTLEIELIFLNPTLQSLFFNIWKEAKSLSLTGLLLMTTIWSFCVLQFFALNEYSFLIASAGSTILPSGKYYTCDTMFNCFIYIISYGLRGNGFTEDVLPTVLVTDSYLPIIHFLFSMAFYVVTIIILLNVFLSNILESFEKARKTKYEIDSNTRNKCFVCDIERNRFDVRANYGITFSSHSETEHQKWNYVAFLIYIFDKPVTNYTGIEQYIAELVSKKEDDLSFFPLLRSLSLEEFEESG
eukprot:gene959-9866_t